MKHHVFVLLVAAGAAAGAASGAERTPRIAPHGVLASRDVAHIYFNIATGEKVATILHDGVAVRGDPDKPVWVVDNDLPCANFGQTQDFVAILDYLDSTSAVTTGYIFLDWGDIPQDSVVDAVTVQWATQHQDTDTDGDGIGDGVPGFGASWSWYDGDNGFNICFTRTGLSGLTLFDLPGAIGPVDPNLVAVYTVTVDLASTFDTSLTFEIADSDGDPQGAAVHNEFFALGDLDSDTIPDGDLDGDGLADFAYALQYIQPGTVDFDGDTIPDGNPAAAALTAWGLAAPSGDTVLNGGVYEIINLDPLPAGQGLEDAFDIFSDLNEDGFFEPVGTFWYGGFSCNPYVPFAQFEQTLYGPTLFVDCMDFAPPEGVLNFFDVAAFLQYYNDEHPIADLAAPFGAFNFFDVSAFLSGFNAGCP